MTRLVRVCTVVLALSVLSGCSWLFGSVDRDFAESSKTNADLIFPAYKDYLDADTSLDEDSRRIRKGTADEWMALIDEALSDDEDPSEQE